MSIWINPKAFAGDEGLRLVCDEAPDALYDELLDSLQTQGYRIHKANRQARHVDAAACTGKLPCNCHVSIRVRRISFRTEVSVSARPLLGSFWLCPAGHGKGFWDQFKTMLGTYSHA